MPVILAFSSFALRELCEDPNHARKQLGVSASAELWQRLADIRAASTIADLIVGNPTTFGMKMERLRLRLGRDSSVVLSANHLRLPLLPDGMVDWARVSYLRVEGIGPE